MEIIKKVEVFHTVFGHPVLSKPQIPSTDRVNLRIELIKEELEEFEDAAREGDIVKVADALGDILYVVAGAALEFGLGSKMDEVFTKIHSSNMSKILYSRLTAEKEQRRLATEGKEVTINERQVEINGKLNSVFTLLSPSGKIIKPSTYQEVDLTFVRDGGETP